MGGNALRIRGIAIVCVAGLLAACGSSTSSDNGTNTASAPGITATTITIGSTQPLTGRAAPGYSEISAASSAYFQYLNAKGGIFGRTITYTYYDDGYNPTNTASLTRKLILEDKVFALFSALGTPTHQAVVDYINAQKVPDLFVSSGCNCWNDVSKWPWTFGWQPDYTIEGKILGQYVQQSLSGKKVGYFFQNDEFGTDGVKGLDAQLGASSVPDAARQNYVPTNTNVKPQIAALQASGAQVVVAFSIPAFTALALLAAAGSGYHPIWVVSNVGSDVTTLTGLLKAFSGGKAGGQLLGGMVTDTYLPLPGNSSNPPATVPAYMATIVASTVAADGSVISGNTVEIVVIQTNLPAETLQQPRRAVMQTRHRRVRHNLVEVLGDRSHVLVDRPGIVVQHYDQALRLRGNIVQRLKRDPVRKRGIAA